MRLSRAARSCTFEVFLLLCPSATHKAKQAKDNLPLPQQRLYRRGESACPRHPDHGMNLTALTCVPLLHQSCAQHDRCDFLWTHGSHSTKTLRCRCHVVAISTSALAYSGTLYDSAIVNKVRSEEGRTRCSQVQVLTYLPSEMGNV